MVVEESVDRQRVLDGFANAVQTFSVEFEQFELQDDPRAPQRPA